MEFVNFMVQNPWLLDIFYLLFVVGAAIVGLIRGFWRSLWNLAIVAGMLLLSYFVITPYLANWICDDLFTQFGIHQTAYYGGMEVHITSFRDIFTKFGTIPTLANPYSFAYASELAYTAARGAGMFACTIITYLTGWLLSTLLYFPWLPAQHRIRFVNQHKLRPLGMLFSAVVTFLSLFILLNSLDAFAYPLSSIYVNGSDELIEAIGREVVTILHAISPTRSGIAEAPRSFLSFMVMEGSMFTFTNPDVEGETLRSMGSGWDFFKDIFTQLGATK